ncbi:hypothetical protein B0H14DRAFT_3869319 [Mycena olivaceomarginata]|nr:hypothetical protein B0H14DRAFT_3869319 [Mycena olivaceomarginata]
MKFIYTIVLLIPSIAAAVTNPTLQQRCTSTLTCSGGPTEVAACEALGFACPSFGTDAICFADCECLISCP